MHRQSGCIAIALTCLTLSTTAYAQTGVSDDRVSLPEGPGSLEGVGENVGVNPNMGMMSHTIPIPLPFGHSGTTPSLALSYSSGGGSGVVGMGWDMAMPSIERTTFRRLPLYDDTDDFAAGGSDQLVRLPGTDPAVYRSRYERGFVRYTWMDEGDGAEGYWIAEFPDGSKGYFGATADGTLVPEARVGGPEGTFRYHMVEKVDVYGHRLIMGYQKVGNWSYNTSIGYVFTDPDEPTYRVDLEYEDRSDASGVDYISDGAPGFDLRLTQRLTAVNVFSRGVRIRRVVLNYAPLDASDGFSRLARVETFGLEGGLYPVVSRFEYSQGLGARCQDEGCRPFVTDMGTLGVSFAGGQTTLLDINGDGLADMLDTSQPGNHRFFFNVPAVDGTSRFDTNPVSSDVGTQSTHNLSAPGVQVLDIDGDGFTDLVNARTGQVLVNKGNGDWEVMGTQEGTSSLADALVEDIGTGDGTLQSLRFIDFNNDKKIDVIKATQFETSFFENQGEDGFELINGTTSLGVGFEEDGLELADVNGDGLLDVTRLQVGSLSFWLNLGWGKWSDRTDITGLPIANVGELEQASLEDINGDAMADLVVVVGTTVKYALNNNSAAFDEPIVIDNNSNIDGDIPQRDANTTVLFADMNANGSTDIVWIDNQGGRVRSLELFPLRPNLMTRITNDLGMVTDIVYETAAQQMARDGGLGVWRYKLPYPMNLVFMTDKFDLLTDVHTVTEYRYHDGFYDGIEKQFRGFERVEVRLFSDASQEEGVTEMTYDVGAADPYRNGLLLTRSVASDGRPLSATENTYEDCPVAELSGELRDPVRHICMTASRATLKEGRPEVEWLALESRSEYDGYGNVTLASQFGVVSAGGGACEPCDRGEEVFGEPCGQQCLGDERFVQTEYVPTTNTGGRWIISAPFRRTATGRLGSDLATETLTYYDGPDFEGLPLGNLNQGKVTRTTRKIDTDSDAVIETGRSRFDAHGNVVETIDPNGSPDRHAHRRQYTYDVDGVRTVRAEVLLEDADGQPYRLRRDLTYEPFFDNVSEATEWMRVVNGQVVSSRRAWAFVHDEFGRVSERYLPGSTDAPDSIFAYELSSPTSRIVTRTRSEVGGDLDLVSIRCLDGRGRTFQMRHRLDTDRFQVSGFRRFNARSSLVEAYQPYVSNTGECEVAPPLETRSARFRYDAEHRVIETTLPDDDVYGTPSVLTAVYTPLATAAFDGEDNDETSAHADTPMVVRTDGLGRVIAHERQLRADGAVSNIKVHFDGLGRVIGTDDPGGNRKTQTYDLLGRVLSVSDPNQGAETRYTHDAAGNVLTRTDARGVTTRSVYDGTNRLIEQYDEADREGTRIAWIFDHDPDCPSGQCLNTEAQIASQSYPGLDGERAVDRFGYDLRGRIITSHRALAGHDFGFAMAYDNADRLTATTYPDGQTIERTYDDASRPIRIGDIVHTIEYDARNLLSGVGCGDGTSTTMTYDSTMRLSQMVTGGPTGLLQGFAYTRDRQSNILTIDDLAPEAPGRPSFATSHAYDAWYRTISTHYDADGAHDEVIDIDIDDIGNIVSAASSKGGDSLAHVGPMGYDSFAPNALTEAAGELLDYDAAGNAVETGALRFDWDHLGRMTEATRNGEQVGRYVYGANQSRVAKIEGDSVALYASKTFEVRDGISSLYIKLGRHRVARIESDALATSLLTDHVANGTIDAADAFAARDGDSAPLLMSSVRRLLMETGPDEGITYLHRDHLGSITLATGEVDGQHQVMGHRAFYPLGQERPGGSGYVDEYGFTGQEIDRATGLIHFDWRYYNPRLGRWLSIDPLFATATMSGLGAWGQSTTAYAYVSGRFANAYDPTGLKNPFKGFMNKIGVRKKGNGPGMTKKSQKKKRRNRIIKQAAAARKRIAASKKKEAALKKQQAFFKAQRKRLGMDGIEKPNNGGFIPDDDSMSDASNESADLGNDVIEEEEINNEGAVKASGRFFERYIVPDGNGASSPVPRKGYDGPEPGARNANNSAPDDVLPGNPTEGGTAGGTAGDTAGGGSDAEKIGLYGLEGGNATPGRDALPMTPGSTPQ